MGATCQAVLWVILDGAGVDAPLGVQWVLGQGDLCALGRGLLGLGEVFAPPG